MKTTKKQLETLGGESVSNGGKEAIEISMPYIMEFSVEGSADLLFHKWDCNSVETKAKASKNSEAKKTDDLESYVYRAENGNLAIPGEYFRMSMINAAKFKQDPRSPRKSAMDLFKAGIVALSQNCDLGTNDWDYLDKRRVKIQQNSVTRVRPAMLKGWHVSVQMIVNLPEYIDAYLFIDVLGQAGRLIGVGDYRPTFGRFVVKKWNVVK